MSTDNASTLLTALAAVGQEDLAALRERIEGLEREIESLKQVERIVDRRLYGKPERTTRAAVGKTLSDRVLEVIREDGPATIDDLAATLEKKPQAVRMAIQRAGKAFVLVNGNRYAAALPPKP
jgi:predicted metal-dependent hydrolase